MIRAAFVVLTVLLCALGVVALAFVVCNAIDSIRAAWKE